MILVTGASGLVGGSVLQAMTRNGHPAVALYRSAEDARKASPGTTTVIADFADKKSLVAALEGIETVFLVCAPIPQLVELESNMIEACKESGGQHIVQNSALAAGDYPKSFPSWHRKVEDKLKASGLPYTILRPNSFMQNLVTYLAPSIRTQGAFYAAMDEAKMSLIDVRDVAEVAVKVLVAPKEHTGKTYELNGPEAVSYSQVAEKISRVTGRPVRYVDLPEAQQRKAMLDAGMPEWQVTALLELQQYYTAQRKGADVTPVLKQLLGRAPATLDQFIQEFQDQFRASAAGA